MISCYEFSSRSQWFSKINDKFYSYLGGHEAFTFVNFQKLEIRRYMKGYLAGNYNFCDNRLYHNR